ncbi:MAG TPA: glutamate ABC transporter substrate-binding protein [Mycobacteriales bacterium]|nr:glutamate ABC transporter substrate-binding protein [Mycobacteriales bacterium]
MTARRRAGVAALAAVLLAGCASSRPDLPRTLGETAASEAPVTASATPPPKPPACGNPVASYAPDGPLPAPGQVPPGSTMATIRDHGRLVVGVDGATTLFSARNPLTGRLEGFDIDILREVSRALFGDPDRIEYRVIPYSQRVAVLEQKQVDLVADTFTINCARWARIAFSSEYFRAGQRLLVRSDSKFDSIRALDAAQGSVCVAKGSTNLDNLAPYKQVKVVAVDDLGRCLVLFQDGSVDAVTADDTVLEGFRSEDPYAKVVGPRFSDEPYGIGVRKDRADLVRFVNAVLERLRADGTWQRIYTRWLGSEGGVPEPPAPVYGRSA